ncbi:MAG: phage virion morphogenesis protein [Proteobacteria bacterium]|nr:phage virion morphogenesis protein [Pseudomonadota bacterium]
MIEIEINSRDVQARIEAVASKLEDMRPLFQRIAGVLEHETEANFAAQGRPHWVPLAKATIAARMKRNKGSSVLKILQDSGSLAASISSDYGADFAVVGSNKAYAAIHQFGGTIDRAPYSTRVRLRTDRKGNLIRQGDEGSAKGRAVFARENGAKAHKQFRETWHTVDAYQVTIPSRPYLPFTGTSAGATLQPEAAQSVLDAISSMLSDALK